MIGPSLLWRSIVAFTHLKVKSAKCLCLLLVVLVLVLLLWSCCCLHHCPRPICSWLRPDVRDRKTSDRQTSDAHHPLMPPALGRGHNNLHRWQRWEILTRAGGLRHDLLSEWIISNDAVWRLLRTSGLSREQRGLGRLKLAHSSPRHTWLGHHFQGQKVKGQLVADVLNSQHSRTDATWRINMKLLLTYRGRRHIIMVFGTAC